MSTSKTGTATLVIDNFSQLATYKKINLSFTSLSYFGIYPKIDIPVYGSLPQHVTDSVFVFWYNAKKEMIHYKVSIMNVNMEKLYTLEYKWEFDGSNCTFAALISRAKLLDPKNGYLENGKLTLLCEAEIIDKNVSNIIAPIPRQDLGNLSADFQSLLIDGKFSDANLIVGKERKQFHVHKAILSARSAVFAAMFEHDCEEKRQNEVKITDIDPETCDALLVYIYTGKVKQMDRYALDLLQAADKYQLESLKNMTEDFLCSTLSVESAANVLFVADLHGTTKLKDKCLEFISMNIIQVKDTDGWKALESNAKLLKDLFFHLAIKNNK